MSTLFGEPKEKTLPTVSTVLAGSLAGTVCFDSSLASALTLMTLATVLTGAGGLMGVDVIATDLKDKLPDNLFALAASAACTF